MQDDEQALRTRALERIQKKREFTSHLIAYILVNGFLVVLWATVAGGGFFWPMFPLIGWGIGLFFHGWKHSLRSERHRPLGAPIASPPPSEA